MLDNVKRWLLNRTENAMAPHSSTLAWKIPWMEEPGRLQSMGVVKSWTRLSNFTFTFHFNALEKEMATCGEQAPPMAKVMRKEARHTQRRDQASGAPRKFSSIYPQNQSLPTFCFVLSPTPLTLWGAIPHYLSLKKRVSLQLQWIIPGCDSVSTYKLLWKSSSLPE